MIGFLAGFLTGHCGMARPAARIGGRECANGQGPVPGLHPGSCTVAVRTKPAKPGMRCSRSCEGMASPVELT